MRWLIVTLLIGCRVLIRAQNTDSNLPLIFRFREDNGQFVEILANPNFPYERFDHRTRLRIRAQIDGNKQAVFSSRWNDLQLNQAFINSQFGPVAIFYRTEGMCSEHEVEVTYSNGQRYTQRMEAPEPRLSNRLTRSGGLIPTFGQFIPDCAARSSSASQRANTNHYVGKVVVNSNHDLKYWTRDAGTTVRGVPQTFVKMLRCRSLFTSMDEADDVPCVRRSPLNQNQFEVFFTRLHIQNECTFRIGQIIIVRSEQFPNCFAQYYTDVERVGVNGQPDVDSLDVELRCQHGFSGNTADFQCQSNQQQNGCRVNCSPDILSLSNDTTTTRLGGVQTASGPIKYTATWSFQPRNRLPQEYRIRIANVDVNEFNVLTREYDAMEFRATGNRDYLQFDGNAEPTNYSLQVCAIEEFCSRNIDWSRERMFPFLVPAESTGTAAKSVNASMLAWCTALLVTVITTGLWSGNYERA